MTNDVSDAAADSDAGAIDLQRFVTDSLVQIADGVSAAIRELANRKHDLAAARINPPIEHGMALKRDAAGDGYGAYRDVVSVEFDLAVTASSSASGDAGATIKVKLPWVAETDLRAAKERVRSGEAANRIRFNVPMMLPHSAH